MRDPLARDTPQFDAEGLGRGRQQLAKLGPRLADRCVVLLVEDSTKRGACGDTDRLLASLRGGLGEKGRELPSGSLKARLSRLDDRGTDAEVSGSAERRDRGEQQQRHDERQAKPKRTPASWGHKRAFGRTHRAVSLLRSRSCSLLAR